MDRHDLYELCVQSPLHLVPLLRAIHGQEPAVLGEDFSGTAALSCRWVQDVPEGSAIAVDLDAATLARHGQHARITRLATDVRTAAGAVDVLFAGNFSIGYMHTRAELVAYLRHARSRLRPGGMFVCDTYGGESSFLTGHVHRHHNLPDGRRVRYTWEQRYADPLTGMVTDVLHFRIEKGGVIEEEWPDAFVYEWRLWAVPELRDAMVEAGFGQTDVFQKLPDAEDEEGNIYVEAVRDPEELDDSFIVLVAARV
ncbi:MAG: class I SAM-dependent methyltransferase [Leptolyngbya sp. PLA3]|nr:MAG: class I SAM-dependent methyltransferase [Cyanobacteria bacterium CYA]MCE7967926.1 class I SAM-dependent methyltransferase [Leptolyngbya sp. PL-A3]